MLRIGITQRVQDLPERGERRDCLDQAWTPLLESIGLLAVPLPNRSGQLAAYLEGLSGLILSGGGDLGDVPERDACEHALLDRAAATGLPVFGVCRGLQMMNVHAGGSLQRIDGHVRTRHPILAADVGDLALGARHEVNSFHAWGVDALGKDLLAAATAPAGGVEAIRHATLPWAAVMWHPERAPDDARDRELLRRFFGGTR